MRNFQGNQDRFKEMCVGFNAIRPILSICHQDKPLEPQIPPKIGGWIATPGLVLSPSTWQRQYLLVPSIRHISPNQTKEVPTTLQVPISKTKGDGQMLLFNEPCLELGTCS